jgi:glutamate-ammonia-ligase adenylyltransferase
MWADYRTPPRFRMDLTAVLAYSRYATAALVADPALADELAASIDRPFDWTPSDTAIDAAVAAGDAAALDALLRRLRRRVLLHTIARDLSGKAPLLEVCAAVTHLADSALRAAVTLHHRALATIHGEPCSDEGEEQQLIAIGMGKLGGRELNASSDIDLVFVYPEEGETRGPRRIANREFFDRLGRRVIGSLDDRTAEGFVFRVDMRLRPYGDSGPLTTPYSALERYLVTQGRAWERYAWQKARFLTGTQHDELAALVTPFVYRKYLDYDAYEGLRDIHGQIREQGRRRDYLQNIKLGPGGIREIEFTIQAIQLVRGGREPALRARGTLPALAALAERDLLPDAAVTSLRDAYFFLRNLEHRLQYRDDQQTQMLPEDDAERAALAEAMGYADIAAFEAALAVQRDNVEEHFNAVFGAAPPAARPAVTPGSAATTIDYAAIWREDMPADTALAQLAAARFRDSAALAATLDRVRSGTRYLQLPALSRKRFDELLPQLLATAAETPVAGADAQTVFERLLALLETVARRSAYLALLTEHPPLLPRLANLMGSSAWAADYLTRHPILLDELLDARNLLAEPDWDAWRTELARQLAHDRGDGERQVDALRHFQHAQSFRLLVQDLGGRLTVERLADHLSALADIVLDATLSAVWAHLHGADAAAPRFAVIGYGKLGGKELGYASDLDLVFLYDDEGDDGAPERYARLSQRLITWLTSTTAAGPLYDTDLRLRPDGAAGMLSRSFPSFCRYQREQAWTWEHQALTRARFVAGDAAIGAAFEAERDALLRLARDPAKLAADVVEMRRKMLAGHPNPTPQFDLKHDPGGMVDIEFAVQYLVLAHAHAHPSLTRNAGNIALLHLCGELGLVPSDVAAAAADAYREYRRLQHQVRLTGAAHARVDTETQTARRAAVDRLWAGVFGARWA